MAEIRVEKKGASHTWLWVLIAVVVLVAAVFLLDRAGYIDIPALGALPAASETPAQLASITLHIQEA